MAPPFRVNAASPMLMPSPSKSADVTVYRNERSSESLPAALYDAWRVLAPMVSASRGVPVTVTLLSNVTKVRITSPAA